MLCMAPHRAIGTRMLRAIPERAIGTRMLRANPERAIGTRILGAIPKRAIGTRVLRANPERAIACVYAYTRAVRRVRGAPKGGSQRAYTRIRVLRGVFGELQKGGLPAFVFAYTREDHEYREHDHRSQERDLGRAQAGTML